MTETFNIVNFIETNPLSTLSNTYNHRLLEKIKTNFTDNEQQLFISSFYCYLNYHPTNDFVIDLDNVWKWLGFNKKYEAKRCLIKNFIIESEYKISLRKLAERSNNTKGGQNKETILLNIQTFKKFCMKAGTKRADEIHDYFIKLEEILHEVLKEESEDLRRQLEQSKTKTEQLENNIIDLKKSNEIDRHTMLCNQYNKTRLVYIMKLETLNDGKYIIKIGESADIKSRCQAISCYFGIRVMVLDVFPCELNYEFEQFLHRQPVIYHCKYNGLINNTKKSTEAYIISNTNTYNRIKRFIQGNIVNYNSKDKDKVKFATINNLIELYKDDKPKLEQMIYSITSTEQPFIRSPIENIDNEVPQQRPIIDESIYQEREEVINNAINSIYPQLYQEETPQSRTNNYSPKVQIYDPNDLTKLINVFDSITEATRNINGSSYSHIKYASRHKIIYMGFRWNLVPNCDPEPFVVKDIGKTISSNEKRSGLVAMLNMEKTQVIKVFLLQKDAALHFSIHKSLICNAIKYGTSVCSHFWVYWDDLDCSLKNEYLQSNTLPTVSVKSKGMKVQQINPQTNQIEREFPSITDATKELKISTKSIKRSSLEDIPVQGWLWKIV